MRDLLLDILAASAPAEACAWLRGRLDEHAAGFQRRPFYYDFSGVSRHFPKRARVVASPEQLAALSERVPGFTVAGWDVFRLARVVLLEALGEQDGETFLGTVEALLNTADFREEASIYSAIPLLPLPDRLVEAARDGLRSNIVDVYDAIALDNPFPAAHFTDEAWNQMVLKALFINRPLHRIVGLDRRRNAELSAAVSYLAHERWAAGRTIPSEAWRNCVGFVDEAVAGDLRRLLAEGGPADRRAAALVVAYEHSPSLADLREALAGEIAEVEAAELTWDLLGESLVQDPGLNGSPTKP
jgi:hypothetical protein